MDRQSRLVEIDNEAWEAEWAEHYWDHLPLPTHFDVVRSLVVVVVPVGSDAYLLDDVRERMKREVPESRVH